MKKDLYSLFCAVGIGVAALLPTGFAHADLINPSFESASTWTTANGWTYVGPGNFSPVITHSAPIAGSTFTARDGNNLLHLGTATAAAERKVYQTFSLSQAYDLSVWYTIQGTGAVALTKPDSTSSLIYSVVDAAQTGWLHSVVHLAAGSYTLAYSVTGRNSWGVFDAGMEATPVPIPAGLWLLGFGLTGLGVMRKRLGR